MNHAVQNIEREQSYYHKEQRECCKKEIPLSSRIRWLYECHSKVGENGTGEMMARRVAPQTIRENLGECSNQWLYGHGGTIDPVTGLLDWGPEISRAAKRLVRAQAEVASGLFKPNIEKNELTYTLENPEHGGRTRGYGSVSWYHSFPADQGTYRSCQRKKEETERIHKLEVFVHSLQERERS